MILQSKIAEKKKIDHQKILLNVARSMTQLKKPERLLKIITKYLGRELGLSHASVLVLDPSTRHFIFADSRGKSPIPLKLLKFEENHPLVTWFQTARKKNKISEDYLEPALLEKWSQKGSSHLVNYIAQLKHTMLLFKAQIIVPGYSKGKLIGILLLGESVNQQPYDKEDIDFFHILTQDCAMAVQVAQDRQHLVEQNKELARNVKEIGTLREKEQKTYYEIMQSLAQEVYAKDPYTFGHLGQVERLGIMTAKQMGLDLSGRKKDILSASLILHDVGKIGIPDHILKKADRLDPDEWKIMQTHVDKGADILEPLTDFKEVAEIVRCHHECFDGTGYPRGIKGEGIPIQARIITVVDSFHAIVSERSYDPSRSVEEGFEELRRCSGTQFDPQVVEAFIAGLKAEMTKRGVGSFLEEDEVAPASK